MGLPRLFAGQRRRLFGYLVGNGLGQALAATAVALLIRRGFDDLIATRSSVDVRGMAVLCAGLLVATMAIAWLRWRASLDAERVGQGYVHAVRMRLFRHLVDVGAAGTRRMSRGALLLRFVGDLSATRNWVSLGLARLVVSGLAVLAALVALVVVQPVIAGAVGIAALLAALVVMAAGAHLRARNLEARRLRGRVAALLNDRLAGIAVVESFGQERREIRRVRRASRRLRNALVARAAMIGLLRALGEASSGMASIFALLVGAIQVSAGRATPGDVVAAMMLASLLAPRLRELSRVYEYWSAASVAREKQLDVLRLQRSGSSGGRRGTHHLGIGPTRLELREVVLQPVFRSLDLTIEPGERIAVLGANGAGKSTLLRLIAGIVQPDQGEVLVDSENISRVRWSDLRHAFAMVAPDLPLLRGSLRLNLTYGSSGVDDARMAEILAACQLETLVARLPAGLDTRLAEEGGGLSTGERARIAVARALLVRPRVLLLDEADANLDQVSRAALDNLLATFTGTIVFVTHDLASVALADKVVELHSGTLTEIPPGEVAARLAALRGTRNTHDLRLVS